MEQIKPAPVAEPKSKLTKSSLRAAIAGGMFLLALVGGLSVLKTRWMNALAVDAAATLRPRHEKVLGLFQASFYFFYDDQFIPGIKHELTPEKGGDKGLPSLSRIVVLSPEGNALFDSSQPKHRDPVPYKDATIVSALKRLSYSNGADAKPAEFIGNYKVEILVPSAQYAVLYTFDGGWIRLRLIALFFAACVIAAALRWLLGQRLGRGRALATLVAWRRHWRLRTKFLATIFAVNLITASIVFFGLTSLQTRQLRERIRTESLLFSQFSTTQVVSEFTNFFYFYYMDRFLPEIKRIVASNENLVRLRIISYKTHSILFDSEQANTAPVPQQLAESPRADLSADVGEQLKTRDSAIETVNRGGDELLSVAVTYRNENQEPLFYVDYLFGYQTLARSLREFRNHLLFDLVPSIALGFLIAAVFAQLLISPIRKLVSALRNVAAGDYDVSVDVVNTDEIGDLVTAFNSMTSELRRKKELRKYLSDSTYRQIMSATESADGIKVGGTRVSATVLFSDIRDFVRHCESLEAEEVTAMLNEYFSEMVEVIHKNGGEVDKFIGDALLAVFYSSDDAKTIRPEGSERPNANPSSSATALQAIYCALEMRERLVDFNARRKALGKNTIEIGVGISHGEIISGPIGSKDRMDFTVIGDVVNVASRIEKASKHGKYTKILFSNQIEQRVRSLLEYEEISTEIRGKEEDVRIYELIGIRDVHALVENLRGSDLALKRRSVELLGQSRNVDALHHVIETLRDRDEATRMNGAVAIGKLVGRDHTASIDALFAALRGEKSEKVLSALISVLGRLCGTERVLDLAPYLSDPNERIVANTIEAIGQVRSPKCSDLMIPKLASRNNRVKANAAMALFAAGHVEVIDTLKPMLMHSDALMRSSAAFAIGELTVIAGQAQLAERWRTEPQMVKMFLAELQECVPMLVSLLRDKEAIVKRQAVIALGKIKDKSAVLPIIEMIQPGETSRELIHDVSQALREIGSHKLVREVIARLS